MKIGAIIGKWVFRLHEALDKRKSLGGTKVPCSPTVQSCRLADATVRRDRIQAKRRIRSGSSLCRSWVREGVSSDAAGSASNRQPARLPLAAGCALDLLQPSSVRIVAEVSPCSTKEHTQRDWMLQIEEVSRLLRKLCNSQSLTTTCRVRMLYRSFRSQQTLAPHDAN